MKNVFEASTAVEAHMIGNLLDQNGVAASVEGEHLQGGVGELHAIGLVRVVVEDTDYEKASAIVADWESQQPVDMPADKTSNTSIRSLSFFLAGLAVGIVSMIWFYRTPVSQDGIDFNGDGINEVTWRYEGNRLSRSESDRNRDGNVDWRDIYNRRGVVSFSQVDDNFDGTYETKYRYKNGIAKTAESDHDGDGETDYRVTFIFGALDQIDILDPKTGNVRKKQKYEQGKLKSAEYDSTGDGEFDVAYEYDFYEEISEVKR